MDLQPIFRASAQAYKLYAKNLTSDFQVAKSAKAVSRDSSNFNQQARQILKDIVQLRDFLLNNRKEYVNIDHWLDGACLMSDYERDRIDSQSQGLLKSCQYVLSNLTKAVNIEKSTNEVQLHRQAVIEIITDFLKAVTKIYSEQRAIRVQRSVECRKLSRLENLVAYTIKLPTGDQECAPIKDDAKSKEASCGRSDTTSMFEDFTGRMPSVRHRKQVKVDQRRSKTVQVFPIKQEIEEEKAAQKSLHLIRRTMHQKVEKCKLAALEADVEHSKEEWTKISQDLKPEEKIQLEVESNELRHEFTSKVDEIKKLEGKVVEIAKLQDIFTEKVLLQEGDIYRVNDVAIHATENIKTGNESIRQAMKKKASMRVYIIFSLIVLSFTLLFLDWFNP